MSNKIFLDSSVLVEYTKGTKVDLFEGLAARISFEKCISQVILSEYTFYLLIIEGGKAPLTLKRNKAIGEIINQKNPTKFLETMTFLSVEETIIPLYLRLMEKYNLLPNDALILATCILNGIGKLASYDVDFRPACIGEGIQLIQQIKDLD